MGTYESTISDITWLRTFHAFNGFKMITDDYVKNDKWRAFLMLIYWTFGILLFVLGLSVIANIEKFIEGV